MRTRHARMCTCKCSSSPRVRMRLHVALLDAAAVFFTAPEDFFLEGLAAARQRAAASPLHESAETVERHVLVGLEREREEREERECVCTRRSKDAIK